MPASFPVLFALLVAIPGVLIPSFIIHRMRQVLVDQRRDSGTQMIARGTMVVMIVLIAFSVYAALAVYSSLDAVVAR